MAEWGLGGDYSDLTAGIGKYWSPDTRGPGAGGGAALDTDLTPSAQEWVPGGRGGAAAATVGQSALGGVGSQWAPSSSAAGEGALFSTPKKSSSRDFVPGGGGRFGGDGGGIRPGAQEFVPGGGGGGGGGLKAQASEFKPGAADPAVGGGGDEGGGMVQVQGPGGSVYFVTEEEARQMEQGIEIVPEPPLVDVPPLVAAACAPLPLRRTMASAFMPNDLRGFFAQQAKLMLEQLDPSDPRLKEVPRKFHSILPLDDPNVPRGTAGSCGYPTTMYKVVNNKDGFTYALRRVDNVRSVTPELCAMTHRAWQRVGHANVVPLREIFVANRP